MALSPTELKEYLTVICKRDGRVLEGCSDTGGTSYSFMYKGILLVYGPTSSFSGYLSVKHFSVKDLSLEEIKNISKAYTLSIESIPSERFKELLSVLTEN